jgi:hypothetical protein
MTDYNCPRCGYYTTYKSHFANHINRKKICKPLFSNLDISAIKEEYGLNKKKLAKKKLAKNETVSQIKHPCTYCNEVFPTIDLLTTHQCVCIQNNDNKYYHIMQENEELKDVVSKLNKKMDNIADKLINNINITNSQVNSNNTIIINNFGNENLSYIDKALLQQLIIPPYPAIIKLNEIIHCNDEHPENKNIKISNINGKFLQVYENNAWVHKAKQEVIPAIVDKSYDMIDECYNDNIDDVLPPIQDKRYKNFQVDYENNDRLKKQLCKKTELMLFNQTGVK